MIPPLAQSAQPFRRPLGIDVRNSIVFRRSRDLSATLAEHLDRRRSLAI
jgi:hypothetical protein